MKGDDIGEAPTEQGPMDEVHQGGKVALDSSRVAIGVLRLSGGGAQSRVVRAAGEKAARSSVKDRRTQFL